MKIRLLFLVSVVLFGITPPIKASDLPFTIEKGYLLVEGTFKKDIKAEFIVATGLSTSIANIGLAIQNKIPLAYTADGPVNGYNDKTITFGSIPAVAVAGQTPVSLNMKLSDLADVKRKLGRDVFAVLGMDFFKGKLLRIDFARRVISFLDKPFIADYPGASKSSGDPNRRVFKIDFYEKKFDGSSEISLPVIDGLTYNKKPLRTLVDTGIASAVSFSLAAGKEIGIADLPAAKATKSGYISIALLDKELENVPFVVFGKEIGFDRSLREYGAIIGVGILQNFILTIDGKARYVVLEKP